MKALQSLKEKIKTKPKIIMVLSIIFLMISLLSAIISFEMYLNEEELIKESFANETFTFNLLFIVMNGLTIFFFFLARGLWKLKEWTRFFLIGSSFLSSFYVIYHIFVLGYLIIDKNFENIDNQIELILINIIYLVIYVFLIKYLTKTEIEIYFKQKENDKIKDNFFTINSSKDSN